MCIPVIDIEMSCRKLKDLCKERGVTVHDLRKALRLESVQSCYKWFAGKNIPSIDNLYIIARVLGVRIDDIIVTKDVEIDERELW